MGDYGRGVHKRWVQGLRVHQARLAQWFRPVMSTVPSAAVEVLGSNPVPGRACHGLPQSPFLVKISIFEI